MAKRDAAAKDENLLPAQECDACCPLAFRLLAILRLRSKWRQGAPQGDPSKSAKGPPRRAGTRRRWPRAGAGRERLGRRHQRLRRATNRSGSGFFLTAVSGSSCLMASTNPALIQAAAGAASASNTSPGSFRSPFPTARVVSARTFIGSWCRWRRCWARSWGSWWGSRLRSGIA